MTAQREVFHIAAKAKLLTPQADGADQLLKALASGLSLRASPLAKTPLIAMQRAEQVVLCESSGSTGAPKLIRRTPSSWRASFEINKTLLGVTPDDTYAVLGHLGHSISLYAATEALHIGADLAILSGHTPAQQASALREHEASLLYATPSQLRLLIAADGAVFPKITRLICGGGALDAGLQARLPDQFPATRVIEFFGASETSFISMSDGATPDESVGKAYPGVDIHIDAPLDEVGEIWVKSPYLFAGYEEGDSPLTRWKDGYLAIGEMGLLDADGYLYLRGRRSRMVTVADQNVFPEAIESCLMAQPGVSAAAVIPVADPLRGHHIVAVVQGVADETALRQACRAALGAAAAPRSFWYRDDIPLLAAGKPDLKLLKRQWQERNA